MKNLVLTLTAITVVVICASFKAFRPRNNDGRARTELHKPINLYTLNGIPYVQARKMILQFRDDPTINDNETSVYFNGKVFHSMDSLLNADGMDGFRIYFAKTTDANKHTRNTIVVVSTFYAGTADNDATDTIHEDYFQQTEPYLYPTNASNVNGVAHYDTDGGGALLFLNNPGCLIDACPQTNHYVTCKKAKNMVNAFLNDNPQNGINSTSEWFDKKILDDLDNILQGDANNSGLRIYFAKHEPIDDDPDQDGDYLHCFLLITTKKFNGVNTDNFVCIPVVNKKSNHRRSRMSGGGSGGGGTDNGEQCPTNCTGTTLP